MRRASCAPGSQLFRALPLFVVMALIATACGDESGRPFGSLQIMTAPDAGQPSGDSGSLGVAGNGGPAVRTGTGGTAGAKGLGGAPASAAGTGGLAGAGSAGAGGVPGPGGAHPIASGGAAGGSPSVSGSGGVAATTGSGGGQAPHGSGGVSAGAGGVKGTGGAPVATGGVVGSGGRPASTGGNSGSGGTVPPPGTGGTTPPMGSGGAPPLPGSGGAGGGGTAGRSGGAGGGPATDDCDQLIKDYDAAMADAKVCKAAEDMKGAAMKGGCNESVSAKLAGCGSECTTFVQTSAALDAIRKKWNKAGCSAAACLISLCVVNPTSGTCSPSGMCTDDSILGL